MRKIALGSGVVVALALVMSACGTNGGGSTKGAAGPTAATVPMNS